MYIVEIWARAAAFTDAVSKQFDVDANNKKFEYLVEAGVHVANLDSAGFLQHQMLQKQLFSCASLQE